MKRRPREFLWGSPGKFLDARRATDKLESVRNNNLQHAGGDNSWSRGPQLFLKGTNGCLPT
jgi:hypothetical protein